MGAIMDSWLPEFPSIFEPFEWDVAWRETHPPFPTEVERHEAANREREEAGDRRVVGGIYW